MSSWVTVTGRVRCVAGRIVKANIAQRDGISSGDIEAVNGVVLDVQIGEDCILEVLGNDEVIRPVL